MSGPEPGSSSEPDGIDDSDRSHEYDFASVWVKTELLEEDEANTNEPDINRLFEDGDELNTVKCSICNFRAPDMPTLKSHIENHDEIKQYVCNICDFATKCSSVLQRHYLSKHQEKSPKIRTAYKCDKCEYSTTLKWNLIAHYRKHATEKEYKCTKCPYETAYKYNYMKHSKTHSPVENAVYKCDKCPFKTKFHGHITRHLAKLHNEIAEKAHLCPYCDYSTITKWRLNVHNQKSKQENVLKCQFCDFETYYMCESKRHKRVHYIEMRKRNAARENKIAAGNISSEVIVPDVSNGVNSTSKKDHEKLENNFVIDPDGVEWKSIHVLESNDTEKPFKCLLCDYKSRYKAAVRRHYQRQHTGTENNPYKCLNCDFSTKTRDQIALHNKRSASILPLYCNQCDFSTIFRCQLVAHEKSHYLNKCSACDASYKHKYELSRHYLNIHMGDSLKCTMCDFTAARKDALGSHMTTHTGEKPFKCEYCSYSSFRKSLLMIHMKRYHSDIRKEYTIIAESKIAELMVSEGNEPVDSSSAGEV